MITYCVYARVSTKSQAGPDKTSIEEQLAYCHQWATQQGLVRAESRCEYVDAGITGRIREGRPAFVQMLKDAETGKFDVVLVKFGDRIGRKFRIIINALDDLEEAGVQYRDLNKNAAPVIEPTLFKSKVRRVDIGEKIINVISALMSEEEQDRRVERSIAGRRRAIEAGRYPFGRPPFGYDFEVKQLDSIGRIEKVLVPNLKYYRLLEELPDLLLEQQMGNLKIAALWNKRGVLTPENEKWQNGQVDRLRRTPFYGGKQTYDGGTTYWSHNFPAPWSWETFEAIQQIGIVRARRGGRATGSNSPLVGVLRCGYCRNTMRYTNGRDSFTIKNGKKYPYKTLSSYCCQRRASTSTTCVPNTWSVGVVWPKIVAELDRYFKATIEETGIDTFVQAADNSRVERLESELAATKKELKNQGQRQNQIDRDYRRANWK